MLSVDQVFVMYDRGEELLRYAMTNKIGDVNGKGRSEKIFPEGCTMNSILIMTKISASLN